LICRRRGDETHFNSPGRFLIRASSPRLLRYETLIGDGGSSRTGGVLERNAKMYDFRRPAGADEISGTDTGGGGPAALPPANFLHPSGMTATPLPNRFAESYRRRFMLDNGFSPARVFHMETDRLFLGIDGLQTEPPTIC